MNKKFKILLVIFGAICLNSFAYASNTGGFSIQNDLSNGQTIYIGPNGGPATITMESNPDSDTWQYRGGNNAPKGAQASYYVNSTDNFAGEKKIPDSNSYYNSEADIEVYIFSNNGSLIATCPVNSVYFDQLIENHVTMIPSKQNCISNTNSNTKYYVQDDGSGDHYATLFVHSTT